MNRKGFIIGFVIVSLLLSLGYGIGVYFVGYALSPTNQSFETEDSSNSQKNMTKDQVIGYRFMEQTKPMLISAKDSIRLNGQYLTHENNHMWAILIHGYKSDNTTMMAFGAQYYEKGYNVLLPNNRAHGTSQGDYIGMGWLDKDDIACWVDWIVSQDSQAQIILHGVSMGGATVMMTAGDNLDHVIGYIEDCGYTSVWDIFASELDKRFSLPTFPVLDISNLVGQLKAGYSFKEASSIEQLKKSKRPILFIHGGKDDFVPVEMVYKNYEAANCVKDIYVVENAGHAESEDYNKEEYWNKVFKFIDEKIRN